MLLANDNVEDIPVLVVGAGPAGLAAAIELARHEVPVLLVERRTVLSSHPRATVLSLRSMELMRGWGLESEARERSVDVDWRMLEAETLADAAGGSAHQVGYPSREQSRVLSPVEPACVAQDDVEPLLLAHLRAQPSARVELGSALTGLWAGPDGARAALRDVGTGAVRAVHARYVVAADGARSAVRRTLGVALRGAEDVMAGVTTLFRAPLWDVVGPHRHLLYSVTHGDSPSTFLPAGPSDRWLLGLPNEGEQAPSERRAAELVRRGAGVPGLPVRIERSRSYSSAAQLAERFRSGPVFLVGDAAHRVTPRGGTSLNLALHDGFDLGWKLGWVLRDWAGPALLETYEAERRPVAEHAAARSADPSGSRRAPEQEVHADLGGRIPHVWSDERSTLDLLGTGLTLFAGRDDSAWDAAAASLATRVPVDVRLLDAVAACAVGAAGRSAILVRPDGKPAGVLPSGAEPAAALRAAVAAVAAVAAGLTRPSPPTHPSEARVGHEPQSRLRLRKVVGIGSTQSFTLLGDTFLGALPHMFPRSAALRAIPAPFGPRPLPRRKAERATVPDDTIESSRHRIRGDGRTRRRRRPPLNDRIAQHRLCLLRRAHDGGAADPALHAHVTDSADVASSRLAGDHAATV